MKKLLILSSNTGEGHNSAATAIHSAAIAAGVRAAIRKPLEESGHVARLLAGFYNTLLARKPHWMKNYLRFIDFFRPNDSEFVYRGVRGYMERCFDEERPHTLLSVHPMLNHCMPRFIKEKRLDIAVCTFLTDPFPPFWRGWASPYVDRYFVVREEAGNALTAMGVEPSKIEHVPMPVRSQFTPPTMSEIQDFRTKVGIDDSTTILLNGGARGGGPVLKIYETIKAAAPSSNIIVICGRNKPLQANIERLKHPKTRAFGFVTDMHHFVAAADLVLTKPGAMSTYEALACGVPTVLLGIRALMPQESGMFNAALRQGFGYAVSSFGELHTVIKAGRQAWDRKRDGLQTFCRTSSGKELIERMQPVHAGA